MENFKENELPKAVDFMNLEDGSIKELSSAMTFGEKAIGLTINPHDDYRVFFAKRLMADALDLLKKTEIEKAKLSAGNAIATWEANVFRTNAFNKIVDAQMALVKYITWND
jgi:hypothetical protein